MLFPQLVFWNIGSSNRRNYRNAGSIRQVARNFLNQSKDKDSVYRKVIQEDVFVDVEKAFPWMLSFVGGGHETSSRVLCTALMMFKRHPEVQQKLLDELSERLFDGAEPTTDGLAERLTGENIHELEYLTCVVKEILRFSPPAFRSLGYLALEDITCSDGVTIPKDTIVTFSAIAP